MLCFSFILFCFGFSVHLYHQILRFTALRLDVFSVLWVKSKWSFPFILKLEIFWGKFNSISTPTHLPTRLHSGVRKRLQFNNTKIVSVRLHQPSSFFLQYKCESLQPFIYWMERRAKKDPNPMHICSMCGML